MILTLTQPNVHHLGDQYLESLKIPFQLLRLKEHVGLLLRSPRGLPYLAGMKTFNQHPAAGTKGSAQIPVHPQPDVRRKCA